MNTWNCMYHITKSWTTMKQVGQFKKQEVWLVI